MREEARIELVSLQEIDIITEISRNRFMEICGKFTEILRKKTNYDYSNYTDFFPFANYHELAANYRELFFQEINIIISKYAEIDLWKFNVKE